MLHLQPVNLSKPYLTDSINFVRVLENTDHFLIEVKKVDIGDVYENRYWLKVNKDQLHINILNLRAIDSSRDIEERFFEEGYLKFNAEKGIFIEKFNSGQHQYQILNGLESDQLIHAIQNYFADHKQLAN